MATDTKIEWASHTWNPVVGCRKVSEGCKHCYAERDMTRYDKEFRSIRKTAPATFLAPLARDQAGGWKWPDGDRVFVCSWSDFFIEEADAWRDQVWSIIRKRPGLTFLLLTKRAHRIEECLPADWGPDGYPNVWLGVSAENQERWNERVPILMAIPAVVRFVSAEPLIDLIDPAETCTRIGPDDAAKRWNPGVDWVIIGGESGPDARPMHPSSVRHFTWWQAVCHPRPALFLKQWGGERDKRGGAQALFDGRLIHEFPEPRTAEWSNEAAESEGKGEAQQADEEPGEENAGDEAQPAPATGLVGQQSLFGDD